MKYKKAIDELEPILPKLDRVRGLCKDDVLIRLEVDEIKNDIKQLINLITDRNIQYQKGLIK